MRRVPPLAPCSALLLALSALARAEDAPSAAPTCPPGRNPGDEAPAIRALSPELIARYLPPDCPPVGCAGTSAQQSRVNLRKGRVDDPTEADIDPTITLAALLADSPDDRERIRPDVGVRLVGFVRHVWKGGVESANCRVTELAWRDTHIDLYLDDDPAIPNTRRVITEVTPRTRALAASRGQDWSTEALERDLEGRWVEITGWTFFDVDHCNETANTRGANCGGPNGGIWRQTGWEVHPITSIRVLPGRPQ